VRFVTSTKNAQVGREKGHEGRKAEGRRQKAEGGAEISGFSKVGRSRKSGIAMLEFPILINVTADIPTQIAGKEAMAA